LLHDKARALIEAEQPQARFESRKEPRNCHVSTT
jgi:hypothetical protein